MKTTWSIMGMPIGLEVLDEDVSPAVCDVVRECLEHVDETFSTYKSASEISRLNRGELARASASTEVQEVLVACERLRDETQGYFNIEHEGAIDPSGYVKGWAIKRATELLEQRGIRRYCLDAGGDIQVHGPGPNGPWKIGIANPVEPTKLAKIVYLDTGAVATSGTYRRGHHIYNPHTGNPVTDPLSLTVVGPAIDRADALATAAFAMGRDGLGFVHARGHEAMMIMADTSVLLTPGFSRYEQPRR